MDKHSILSRVDSAIEILRPFLHADGGDLEVVDITDDIILLLKPSGACKECPHIDQTIQSGISEAIKKEVPEIKEIKILY
jgi:Fe-S cluster biogenesis protein NfuA